MIELTAVLRGSKFRVLRDSVWTHPNNDACSGTDGLPRRLLPESDSGRCPKIKTELLSRASSTRLAGSDSVVSSLPGVSMGLTSLSDRTRAGNSFWCSALSVFQTESALSPMPFRSTSSRAIAESMSSSSIDCNPRRRTCPPW